MVALALERQHGVDDVLEHARPGERAVLGDVADEHDRRRRAAWPRRTSRWAHSRTWTTEPGARRELGIGDGLDAVDDHELGLHLVDGGDDVAAATSRRPATGRVARRRAARRGGGTCWALSSARHVQRACRGQPAEQLQQQRALADARLAAEQRDRARARARRRAPGRARRCPSAAARRARASTSASGRPAPTAAQRAAGITRIGRRRAAPRPACSTPRTPRTAPTTWGAGCRTRRTPALSATPAVLMAAS